MRRFVAALAARMPMHFRVLYRQFLLRVIDLESLSIEADIPRFLGQFAGILLFFSLRRGGHCSCSLRRPRSLRQFSNRSFPS